MLQLQQQFFFCQPYAEGLEIQQQKVEEVILSCAKNPKAYVLGFEHPLTITLGVRGKVSDDLLLSEVELKKRNISVFPLRRGGHATLHNEGQLVIYPIVPIKILGLSVREYVELLMQTTISTADSFGVKLSSKMNEPGLYSTAGKMVFFGLQIRRGVSFHGLSWNIRNDLKDFSSIRSCGIAHEKFDSLQSHAVDASLEDVFIEWNKHFSAALKPTLNVGT